MLAKASVTITFVYTSALCICLNQSRTITEYNFEGSVLYLSIIFETLNLLFLSLKSLNFLSNLTRHSD